MAKRHLGSSFDAFLEDEGLIEDVTVIAAKRFIVQGAAQAFGGRLKVELDFAAELGRQAIMASAWTCPKCNRQFTRKNQRHACGTGNRAEVLRNRPPELVQIYSALEKFAKALGPVEFVTRERYVLLRTNRIFADAVIMSDALRLAIHLPRKAEHKLFMKVASDRRHVTHVAKVRALEELESMKPFLREAYKHSIS